MRDEGDDRGCLEGVRAVVRRSAVVYSALLVAVPVALVACGGPSKHPKSEGDIAAAGDGGAAADAAVEGAAPSVCSGADLDLVNVLVQSACEVASPPADQKARDVSGSLDVKTMASPGSVAPGGHADVVVTFTNKGSTPLPLDFVLDPTPRFTIEAYTATNKRADLPKVHPPHTKNEGPPPEPSAPGIARVTIAPGGKASAKVGWDAVKLRWAPELVKGTPPEQGYPTAPAGALARGKYLLKVISPLTGIFEGSDHEVSTSKTTMMVQ